MTIEVATDKNTTSLETSTEKVNRENTEIKMSKESIETREEAMVMINITRSLTIRILNTIETIRKRATRIGMIKADTKRKTTSKEMIGKLDLRTKLLRSKSSLRKHQCKTKPRLMIPKQRDNKLVSPSLQTCSQCFQLIEKPSCECISYHSLLIQ